MEENKLEVSTYRDEITKFGKEFAQQHMPKFNTEWLIISFAPSQDKEDEISKLTIDEGIFTKLSARNFSRQYVLTNGEYRERTLEEIQAGKPEAESKKVLSVSCLNDADYFRMDYDGVQYTTHAVGQGRQIDLLWDGTKFNPIIKSDHLVKIT